VAQGVLALWCLLSLASAPAYDAFSEPDGYIRTEEQQRAAWAMLHDSEQVEALYADVAKGNVRATHVAEQLEATLAATGRKLADQASEPGCLAPVVRELSKKCRPNWSYLDFLSQDRPGGLKLRSAIFRAFASRAHERGLENQLILPVVSGLLAVTVAGAVLAEAELAGVPCPSVVDPDLNNLVRDLYKGAETKSPIGTGSTADAIRYEARTGEAVGGKLHTQKGQDYARALEKWLLRHPDAAPADRAAAQAMLDDLRRALAGK
jgi:hypothetical protein